jgi:hypothetical protein
MTTGISPAELLFGRKIRTDLPYTLPARSKQSQELDSEARVNDKRAKERMKLLADANNRAKHNTIVVGDSVLVMQKSAKLRSRFTPLVYKVINTNGSMITAQLGTHRITRNISFFKKVSPVCDKQATRKDAPSDEIELLLSDTPSHPHDNQPLQQGAPNAQGNGEPIANHHLQRNRTLPRKFNDFVMR